MQLIDDGYFDWPPALKYQCRTGHRQSLREQIVILLQLIAESRRKTLLSWPFPYPQVDLASSTVGGHGWTIAGNSDAQHHSSHVIVGVLHDGFIGQSVRDGHLGRHVGNKVAVKQPMTRRWNPVCSHGSVGQQPIGCNGELLFWRENAIGLAVACTVHAEVGAMHVHRVSAVAGVDPAPTYRFARRVG